MCLHLLGSGFGVYKDCNVEIGMGTKKLWKNCINGLLYRNWIRSFMCRNLLTEKKVKM